MSENPDRQRGEIACAFNAPAATWGIKTLVVHSEADSEGST